MSVRTSPWPSGTPCWAVLTADDVDRAAAFYSPVLGWDFEDAAEGYVNALRRGSAVAALAPQDEPGPSSWSLFFATDDADATAGAVEAAGGRILKPAHDLGDLGRMVIASEPAGARFGIWQAGSHIGSSLVNEPGGITWEDLRSTDPAASQAFYLALFGFDTNPVEMATPDYRTFHHQGDPAPLGGMGPMMGTTGDSQWVIYFSVENTDDAVERAQRAGGGVASPAFDSPFGRMAQLTDPFGAGFTVMQNTGQQQPDREG